MRDLVGDLLAAYAKDEPSDLARMAEKAELDAAAALLGRLPEKDRSSIVASMARERAAELLLAMGDTGAAIVAELPGDYLIPILRILPAEKRHRLLSDTDAATRGLLLRRLEYPPGSAGFLMDPLVPAYDRRARADEVLQEVRRAGTRASYYIYAVDSAGTLVGACSMRELLVAEPDTTLAGLMHPDPVFITLQAAVETVLSHPGWAFAHTLPVLDGRSYVGAIRYRTIRAAERLPDNEQRRQDWAETSRNLAEFLALGWSSLLVLGGEVIGDVGSDS
jgi:magnesium transporter